MSEGEDHPSAERLERFLLGTLPADQIRTIIGHLARGCGHCRGVMAPLALLVLGGEPVLDELAEEDAIEEDGGERLGGHGFDLVRALLARSEAARYEGPEAMVRAGELARCVADNLAPERYGSLALADLQARTLAELANAYRVADDPATAEALMLRALRRAELGSGDTRLLARLLGLTAALASERRSFDAALELLDAAHALYAESGDTQRAGRALLSKGLYAGYRGDTEAGLHLLVEGLRWINPRLDPGLVASGVHNLIWLLADDGRVAEAARLLALARPVCEGAISALKQRWLEGRIAAGLGEIETAVAALTEARAGFGKANLGYCTAQVGLDLAAIWLRHGEADRAYGLLGEVLATFSALRVGREGSAALLLLGEATARRRLDTALLEAAIEALGEPGCRPLHRVGYALEA